MYLRGVRNWPDICLPKDSLSKVEHTELLQNLISRGHRCRGCKESLGHFLMKTRLGGCHGPDRRGSQEKGRRKRYLPLWERGDCFPTMGSC